MTFSQMHERLRLELLRRIQRGTVSVSLLARQTGFGQSHLSNFLNSKRQLSLEALDRVMAAQQIDATDLLPSTVNRGWNAYGEVSLVPVVSHITAMFEPFVRPTAVLGVLHLRAEILRAARARASTPRRAWQRFLAIRAGREDATPMQPLLDPEAILLIDRHYNSLTPYRADRPTVFAIRHGKQLKIRYADFALNRLVLRPHNVNCPVDLIDVDPGESPREFITGRVALIVNEP